MSKRPLFMIRATKCGALLCALGACAPGEPPPNVLLISIDSLRPDHLGAYGYERATSPNIDSLAAEGTLFEAAISTTTWTLPAHASMLTSLYPEVHGASQDGTRLSESAVLVSERLREDGYYTGAVVSAPYLHRDFGFDQGWDVYDDEPTIFERRTENANPSHWGVTSPTVHARAVDLIERADGAPFFLFVHYWDVHYDYAPPPPYDTMFDPAYAGDVTSLNFEFNEAIHRRMNPRDLQQVVALYDGEIAHTDAYVGKLFAELKARGLWTNTMVVLTADHGDEFFEHGQKGHRKNLFAPTLDVPIIIKLPGTSTPIPRVAIPVSLVDIVPTILEAAALPALEWSHGTSLLGLMDGSSTDGGFRFAALFDRLRVVVGGDLKLISRWDLPAERGRQLSLYDLRRDPGERENLEAVREIARERLWAAQNQWLSVVEEQAGLLQREALELDPEVAERLRSLGYIR